MSLASWKAEFYKVDASEVPIGQALDHSLLKWTGVLKKNLKKHNCYMDPCISRAITDGLITNIFVLDGGTCALCTWHSPFCKTCHLWLKGKTCNDSNRGYRVFCDTGDPRLLVRELRAAVKRRDSCKSTY
jgi:hypothetical protein